MEIFFLEGFVCWRHERAQWEYEIEFDYTNLLAML